MYPFDDLNLADRLSVPANPPSFQRIRGRELEPEVSGLSRISADPLFMLLPQPRVLPDPGRGTDTTSARLA